MGRVSVYSTATTMTLDAPTRRNLELTESGRGDARKSLMSVLNQTKTPMGSRLLRRWVMQPLVDFHRLTRGRRRSPSSTERACCAPNCGTP